MVSADRSTELWRLPSVKLFCHCLLCKGIHHCLADPLFDWIDFDQTSKYVVNSTSPKQELNNRYSDTMLYEVSEYSLAKGLWQYRSI